MKTASLAAALLALLSAAWPVRAADEPSLLRLVTCQDSWLDWMNDEARISRFRGYIEQKLVRDQQGGFFVPKAPTTLLGHTVEQVFPQSVGTGLGFSVGVNAPFAQARQSFEKQLGQPLKCQSGDGMKFCELPIGEKKTAMLVASDSPGSKTTLLGCYYYYEK